MPLLREQSDKGFYCTLLDVHSIFAIILMGKRKLVALLSLSSWSLVIVVWLFLAVPSVCLQFVIVVFPDHTHLLFLAHLSRRLMGELIVYQSLRRPSVRPSSVRQHFQTSSPLKPLGQLNSNFIWRLLRTRERKFVQMVLVT